MYGRSNTSPHPPPPPTLRCNRPCKSSTVFSRYSRNRHDCRGSQSSQGLRLPRADDPAKTKRGTERGAGRRCGGGTAALRRAESPAKGPDPHRWGGGLSAGDACPTRTRAAPTAAQGHGLHAPLPHRRAAGAPAHTLFCPGAHCGLRTPFAAAPRSSPPPAHDCPPIRPAVCPRAMDLCACAQRVPPPSNDEIDDDEVRRPLLATFAPRNNIIPDPPPPPTNIFVFRPRDIS